MLDFTAKSSFWQTLFVSWIEFCNLHNWLWSFLENYGLNVYFYFLSDKKQDLTRKKIEINLAGDNLLWNINSLTGYRKELALLGRLCKWKKKWDIWPVISLKIDLVHTNRAHYIPVSQNNSNLDVIYGVPHDTIFFTNLDELFYLLIMFC